MRGKLIVFEGLDKTGKTTCIESLSAYLQADDVQHVIFKFPNSNSQTGGIIKTVGKGLTDLHPKAMHLIFSANRWEQVDNIKAYLDNGIHVICDRYFYSGIAYSVGRFNLDLDWCCKTEEGLIVPDLVFYFTASIDTMISRGFGTDTFECRDSINKINGVYLKLKTYDRWRIINGNKSVEDVLHQTLRSLRNLLK